MSSSDRHPDGREGESDELQALRREIRRIYHDIKNPVAIISGNAQLLNEIAQGMELPDDVRLPIGDIEEASDLLAKRVEQLHSLGKKESS